MNESPLAVLRRIARSRPAQPPGRCDLCAAPVDPGHPHLVDPADHRLMCACRPCHLLFTDGQAHLRYRAVPDRYRAVAGPLLDDLPLPVGLAFLYRDSAHERIVAGYPGPAGVTEADVDRAAWQQLEEVHPVLATLRPDVEALLVRRGATGYLVPIDACYELAGRLRSVWRGVDGGAAAHEAVDEFFDRLRERAR